MVNWNSGARFLVQSVSRFLASITCTKQTTVLVLMSLSLIKSGLLRWCWLESTPEHCILCGTLRSKSSQLDAHSYNTFIKNPSEAWQPGQLGCKRCRAARVKWHDDVEVIWSWALCYLIGQSLHIKQRDGRGRDDVETREGREVRGGLREGRSDEGNRWGRGWMAKVGSRGLKSKEKLDVVDKGGIGHHLKGKGREEEGRDVESERTERWLGKRNLPWLCALLGTWETRASSTSGAHKHHLICPVDNILTTSSLDLRRERIDYVEKKQSKRERKGGFSDRNAMNAIQLRRASQGPPCPHIAPRHWSRISYSNLVSTLIQLQSSNPTV